MIKRIAIAAFIFSSLVFIAGCQDKAEKIIGTWKSASSSPLGTQVVVFKNDKMILNGSYTSSVKYENEDKNLVANLDNTIWYIEFLDDNTIMVRNGSGDFASITKYMRITPDEAKSIIEKEHTFQKSEPKVW